MKNEVKKIWNNWICRLCEKETRFYENIAVKTSFSSLFIIFHTTQKSRWQEESIKFLSLSVNNSLGHCLSISTDKDSFSSLFNARRNVKFLVTHSRPLRQMKNCVWISRTFNFPNFLLVYFYYPYPMKVVFSKIKRLIFVVWIW